jgi:hypothetical protein
MDIAASAIALEDRVVAAGISMPGVLTEAGVHRATWDRWKAGTNSPRMLTWQAVVDAAERRINARAGKKGPADTPEIPRLTPAPKAAA